MRHSRVPRRRGIGVAVTILVLGITGLGLLIYTSNRPPQIEALEPEVVAGGDTLRIRGRFFGDDVGKIQLSGKTLPSSAVQRWTDSEIVVELPSELSSGLIRVTAGDLLSRGHFVALRDHVPAVAEPDLATGRPHIESVSPSQPRIGDVVEIRGRHFGSEQGAGAVSFTWQSDDTVARIQVPPGRNRYQSWSERTIRVVVPDGASPGPIVVETSEGPSNELPLDVVATIGTKSYHSKQAYAIHYGVALSVGGSDEAVTDESAAEDISQVADASLSQSEGEQPPPPLENTAFVWLPDVYPLPEQRNRQILSAAPSPMDEVPPGRRLYRLTDLQRDTVNTVESSILFERYAVRTEIIATRVPWEYDVESPIYTRYTRSTDFIPVQNETVSSTSVRTVGRERNPYSRARYIYNLTTSAIDFVEGGAVTPVAVIEAGEGDSLGIAAAYVALARAAAVPARLVGGYRIAADGTLVNHHWAEFYVSTFGWVPVDPVLGGGAHAEEVNAAGISDAREYYFGNVDNRRIAMVVDESPIPELRQDSTTQPVADGNFWRFGSVEVVGELPDFAVAPITPSLLGTY